MEGAANDSSHFESGLSGQDTAATQPRRWDFNASPASGCSADGRSESNELSRVLGGIGGAADNGVTGERLAALLRQLREDMQGLDGDE